MVGGSEDVLSVIQIFEVCCVAVKCSCIFLLHLCERWHDGFSLGGNVSLV